MATVNTTTEYWDVDGVSLNTLTQNLSSAGGSREEPTSFRGANQKIPYAYGEKFLAKIPDRRTMTLEGWVDGDTSTLLKQNWRALRSLLWRPQGEFLLTRRWIDPVDGLLTATGKAQYKSGLSPDIKEGGKTAYFSVDLEMADPFFYGAEITVPLTPPSTFVSISEPGDYGSKKAFLDLVGPLTGIAVESASNAGSNFKSDSWTYYPDIPAGTSVTIDVENFKATQTVGGVTTIVSGKVTNAGSPLWFKLGEKIGPNVPRVYAIFGGTGTVTLRYSPAYH